MLILYDAARCPYCARVRILLAEKQIRYETVEIDLQDRPTWLYEKNPIGKVPVLEEDGFALPESRVIMEYLEERYPGPPLLPSDPGERRQGSLPRAVLCTLREAAYEEPR
jgi:glutathione S-transferase